MERLADEVSDHLREIEVGDLALAADVDLLGHDVVTTSIEIDQEVERVCERSAVQVAARTALGVRGVGVDEDLFAEEHAEDHERNELFNNGLTIGPDRRLSFTNEIHRADDREWNLVRGCIRQSEQLADPFEAAYGFRGR